MISSQSNSMIKRIKKLHTRPGRRKLNQFFVEGIRGVEQVLNNGAPVREVLYSKEVFRITGGEELVGRLMAGSIPVIEVSRVVFDQIAGTDSPQYIMAVLDIIPYEVNKLFGKKNVLLVIVDGIQDPGNLGTIIRTADAAGADGVILLKGTVDLYNPKTVRSTAGSVFSIPVVYWDDIRSLFGELQRNCITAVATDLGSNRNYFEADYKGSTAIIVGSEANGISPEVKSFCGVNVKIPMHGRAESLNAAVACAVILYKAVEQRLT